MSVNEKILLALESLAPVFPGLYEPEPDEAIEPVYSTFTTSSSPDDFQDNAPVYDVHVIRVHLFCPKDYDAVDLRRTMRTRLFKAGFTYPDEIDGGIEETDAGDSGKQHWIFEFLGYEGIDFDG